MQVLLGDVPAVQDLVKADLRKGVVRDDGYFFERKVEKDSNWPDDYPQSSPYFSENILCRSVRGEMKAYVSLLDGLGDRGI